MTESTAPTGRGSELALIAHLDELRDLTGELRDELPSVNDAHLRPSVSILVDAAQAVFDAHGHDPKRSIADDLAGLMSAVRALRIPARDPDLGRTPTLDRLRKSKGLIVAGLADALDSAAAIGLVPQKPPLPIELAAALPRSEIEGLLDGILRRLAQVEKSLDALEEAKTVETNFAQQTGLLNFYTNSMRAEVDLAKLHLTVGDKAVDFNALSRAVETMASLTSGFVATVRAWTGRISGQIVEIANQVPRRVRKVASGVKASAQWIVRTVRRRRARAAEDDVTGSEIELDEAVADAPDGFSIDRVRGMVLAGQSPPVEWRTLVLELDFEFTGIVDLAPLADLTSLQILDLQGTNVSDLTPLAGLASLETLSLERTRVNDLAPLAGLANLQTLSLERTRVSDLAPLAGLASLRTLYLDGTQVNDLAPLAGLASLQTLYFDGTQVSDLAPLAGLTRLQTLHFDGTQVSDLAPLAGLPSLRMLAFSRTQVSDLVPLVGLTSLQALYLQGTAVTDLAPLSGLASLKTLYSVETQVVDLAPLKALTSLRNLFLRGTRVSDLSPLADLASLEILDIKGTLVRDLTPVAHVNGIIGPDGRRS